MSTSRAVLPGVRHAIQQFVMPATAQRMLQLAESRTSKAHNKLTGMLAHLDHFQPQCVHRLQSTADFEGMAQRLGVAPMGDNSLWDVLSEMPSVDGRSITFDELSSMTCAQGYGTLAAIPGATFAYFQGEEPDSLLLLLKR